MELLQLVLYVAYTALASIIALLSTYTGYIFYIRRKYDHLPTPKGRWFYFGHIPPVIAHVNKGKMVWDLFYDWMRDCGTVFVLWQFHEPIVVVADAECIKMKYMAWGILLAAISSKSKSSVAPVVTTMRRQRFLGNGLLTIPDKTRWKIRRRNYDSSFTKSYLHRLVPQFNEVIQKHFIANLRAAAENKVPVELKSQFNSIALEVISWVAFKTDFTKEPYTRITGDDSLPQLIGTSLKGLLLELLNPFVAYLKPCEAQTYVNSTRKLREIGRQCIEVKLKELENSDELPNDIISNILMVTQKEKDITLDDLVDDFLTFYIAGHETTANILAFAIVTLLQNPEMMEIAITEVDEIMNGKDSVDHEDIDKMTYITSVLEETLRLYPIAAAVDRFNDQELTFGSYIIPKQSKILASSYISHRMPEYFDEPLKFDPNRFGPHSNRPTPYIYFPFGLGQRSCIGRAFAMIEAKVILALLLHNFTLSLVDDYEMVIEDVSSLRPKYDIKCIVMPRVH